MLRNVCSREHGPPAHQPKHREDKMANIALLKKTNANRWQGMRVTAGLVTVVDKTAGRLVDPDAKARYVAVSNKTSVPWFVIAVIHEREASQSWKANLGRATAGTRFLSTYQKGEVHSKAGRTPPSMPLPTVPRMRRNGKIGRQGGPSPFSRNIMG